MMVDISDEDVVVILNEYNYIVKRLARSACYSSASIDFSDLCQVGEIAVLQAIKSYDPTCGTTIKSFVSKVVRNEIYYEAARFLGVFTVDFRVTKLAAKAHKLHVNGLSDLEISKILSDSTNPGRVFDINHVRDLRIAYGRSSQVSIEHDTSTTEDSGIEEHTIKDLLSNIPNNNTEKYILKERILGSVSVKDVSLALNTTQKHVYEIENLLKERIKKAIEDITG